jgi:hypothetical protein
LRLRKRDCLGKEYSIFALDWLVGALQIWLQVDIVTDMLLFLFRLFRIICTSHSLYNIKRVLNNIYAEIRMF